MIQTDLTARLADPDPDFDARRRLRRGVTVSAAVMVLGLVAGCSSGRGQTGPSRGPVTAPTANATRTGGGAEAAGCSLAVTQDRYDGFHIGVPSGWNLFTVQGTIVVAKDPSLTEESTVTPVLMTTGLTSAEVFSSSLRSLQREIAASGGSMVDTVTSSPNQSPTATLRLRSGQVTMIGQARVVVLPEPTAHGASVIALLASWAPSSRFAADRSTLDAVGACFGPQPGTLYQVMKDQVFTYAIPVGWTIRNEGQDSIEIAEGNAASASYVLTLLPPGTGVDSPQSLLSYAFAKLGIRITRVLRSEHAPSKRVANGGTEGREYVEFVGTLKGRGAVHGLVYVLADTGSSTPSGVIRLGLATTGLWNSVNGALSHIVNSVQHSFAQDLQQWERLNRQQQTFNRQVEGFDYALNGVDLVHDSTTGATFEAPYDTYRATGPDGPGYYDPANNKLQIETPS